MSFYRKNPLYPLYIRFLGSNLYRGCVYIILCHPLYPLYFYRGYRGCTEDKKGSSSVLFYRDSSNKIPLYFTLPVTPSFSFWRPIKAALAPIIRPKATGV